MIKNESALLNSTLDRPKTACMIFGKSDGGKTFLAKTEIIPRYPRVIFVDSQKEIQPSVDLMHMKYSFCHNFKEALNTFQRVYDEDFFRIICQFPNYDESQLFELIYEVGNVTLIVDEVDMFIKQNSKDGLYKIITKGKHKNVDFFGLSQRPHSVTPTLRGQCNMILSFKQTTKNDLDFFNSFSDDKNRWVEILPKLKQKCGDYRVIEGKEQWEKIITKGKIYLGNQKKRIFQEK